MLKIKNASEKKKEILDGREHNADALTGEYHKLKGSKNYQVYLKIKVTLE